MFKSRSKVLFVCCILATIYAIYLIFYFGNSMSSSDTSEALGGAIATTLITPHIICISIGAIFSWIGFFMRKAWGALVGAIMYSVATLLFLAYFMFTVPLIILGFVGYSKQKKLLNKLI